MKISLTENPAKSFIFQAISDTIVTITLILLTITALAYGGRTVVPIRG